MMKINRFAYLGIILTALSFISLEIQASSPKDTSPINMTLNVPIWKANNIKTNPDISRKEKLKQLQAIDDELIAKIAAIKNDEQIAPREVMQLNQAKDFVDESIKELSQN